MAEPKPNLTAGEAAVAALFTTVALQNELLRKGVITREENDYVMAIAASMAREHGNPGAATAIERICPTCVKVNLQAEINKRGGSASRPN